jgi:membrane fusion protein, macrolide-specific efflux system
MIKDKTLLKRLGISAVGVLVVCLGLKILFFPTFSTFQYTTAQAHIGDLEESVLASSTLEAFQQVSVGAQVSGQLKSLKVNLGDRVMQGQLVAEIDDMTQRNELRNAQAALATRKAEHRAKMAALKQAELAYQRQRRMLAQDASSRSDFEVAEFNLAVTRAEIASLDAQITQAKSRSIRPSSTWATPGLFRLSMV